MWLILQPAEPDEDVLATGERHTVREFAEKALVHIDCKIVWRGKDKDERAEQHSLSSRQSTAFAALLRQRADPCLK